MISAVLGALLVAGGLYLIGEFGFRIFDAVLKTQTQPETWDIVWTSTGGAKSAMTLKTPTASETLSFAS